MTNGKGSGTVLIDGDESPSSLKFPSITNLAEKALYVHKKNNIWQLLLNDGSAKGTYHVANLAAWYPGEQIW